MQKIIDNYILDGEVCEIEGYGNGHINNTYLVTTDHNAKYIFQKINTYVFKDPVAVMNNIELVTEYIRNTVAMGKQDPSRSALEIVPTIHFQSYLEIEGLYWRCYRFIDGAKTFEKVESPFQFYQVGRAVGLFQKNLIGFPIEKIVDTIPDFHHTPKRYRRFKEVLQEDCYDRKKNIEKEIKFIDERVEIMSIITDLLDQEIIPYRVTHNDTKLNNVMLDEVTNEAICLIDLDTVMLGSILFDFGDAIRVGASTAAEDEKDLSKVSLDVELFEEFAKGFLEELKDLLVPEEIDNLVNSAIIITLECGMRFLTDYVDGDKYFKIKYDDHNLVRARNQFKLVEDLEKNKEVLEKIIESLR